MSNKLKPIPLQPIEVLQNQIQPLLDKPTVSTELNRGNEISFKGDTQTKDISIGLQDIDEAILYYFQNIIKPTVIQNNNLLAVPIIYGSPERWKSVQEDGFYRNKDGKLMVPLIMFKRESLEKNRTLGNKLDGNQVHLFQVFEKKYTQRNQYDRFSILTNRIPQTELYATIVPDYVTLEYNCVIFTDYVEQNNRIIEAIQYASDSYWGNPQRFKFRSRINTFSTTTLLEQGQDRACKTTFNITLNGYIIPDTINKYLSTDLRKYYSKCQVVFDFKNLDGTSLSNDTTSGITPETFYLSDSNGDVIIDSNGDNIIYQ